MSKFTSAILEYVYGIAKTSMSVSSCFFYPKPSNIFNLAAPEQVLDFEQFLSLLRKNDDFKLKDENFNKLDAVEFIKDNFEIVNNAKHLSIFKEFSQNTLLIAYYNSTNRIKTDLLFSVLDEMHLGKKKQLDRLVENVRNTHNFEKDNNPMVLIQEQQYAKFVESLDNELKYHFEINLVSPPLQEVISEPDIMNGLNNLISTHPVFKKEFKTFNETEKVSLFKILQPQRYMQKLIRFVRYQNDKN